MMASGTRSWVVASGVLLVVASAAVLWRLEQERLPPGLATGNGRIEGDEVAIATKSGGRVEWIRLEEGDLVETGQALARMDTAELEALLREAKAQTREAVQGRDAAAALVVQRDSECDLAEAEYRRSSRLFEKNIEPESQLDIKRSRLQTARAACDAAEARLVDAEAAIEAANARVDRIQTQIDDALLVSPVRGRVLYRLAEPGEVLPAGGNVLTLLDLTDIYMEIFLPSREAARVSIGADARIVLDAAPEYVIPATVSFVAPEAQFTPKQVETQNEREKLMFRIKVRIPPEIVEPRIQVVKTGVRGTAYVMLEGDEPPAWPASLEARLPVGSR